MRLLTLLAGLAALTACTPLVQAESPCNIAAVTRKVAGFTLLADGLLRLQDVRPAE
jgi:hypothetical protein